MSRWSFFACYTFLESAHIYIYIILCCICYNVSGVTFWDFAGDLKTSGSPSISLRRPPYDFHLASICGPKLRYKHTKELRIMFPMVWLWIHSNDFHFHILPPHVKAVPSQDSGQSHLTTSATIIMWSEHETEPHQCLIAPCILSGKSNSFLSFPRPAVLTNSAGSVLALFEESKPSNNFWHLNSSKLWNLEREDFSALNIMTMIIPIIDYIPCVHASCC